MLKRKYTWQIEADIERRYFIWKVHSHFSFIPKSSRSLFVGCKQMLKQWIVEERLTLSSYFVRFWIQKSICPRSWHLRPQMKEKSLKDQYIISTIALSNTTWWKGNFLFVIFFTFSPSIFPLSNIVWSQGRLNQKSIKGEKGDKMQFPTFSEKTRCLFSQF